MPPVSGLLPSLSDLASWHPEEPTCTPLQSVREEKNPLVAPNHIAVPPAVFYQGTKVGPDQADTRTRSRGPPLVPLPMLSPCRVGVRTLQRP